MTRPELRQAIEQLGPTAGEVALQLYRRGIRGRKSSCTTCPVARYLRQNGAERVSVGGQVVTADGATVRTPAFLRRFLWEFDRGTLPELEDLN